MNACLLPVGQIARQKFPDFSGSIARVEKEGCVDIPDLRWVVPCLGICVRLTIQEQTYTEISSAHPWLQKDSIILPTIEKEGKEDDIPSQIAHLFFSWEKAIEETNRRFGHFDVLHPCNQPQRALYHLLPDAPCKQSWVWGCGYSVAKCGLC